MKLALRYATVCLILIDGEFNALYGFFKNTSGKMFAGVFFCAQINYNELNLD